jgi:hypothetical protein
MITAHKKRSGERFVKKIQGTNFGATSHFLKRKFRCFKEILDKKMALEGG